MDDTYSTRRDFLATTVAPGFALAVQPISATALATDSTGLIAADVKIPSPS